MLASKSFRTVFIYPLIPRISADNLLCANSQAVGPFLCTRHLATPTVPRSLALVPLPYVALQLSPSVALVPDRSFLSLPTSPYRPSFLPCPFLHPLPIPSQSPQLRSLPAGDAMWVARRRRRSIASAHAAADSIRITSAPAACASDQTGTDADASAETDRGAGLKASGAAVEEEYVLDFLVEVTRAEDLINAIRSRRFRDQRLRLQVGFVAMRL